MPSLSQRALLTCAAQLLVRTSLGMFSHLIITIFTSWALLLGHKPICGGGKEVEVQARRAARLPPAETGHREWPTGSPSLETFAHKVESLGQRPP